MFSRMMALAKSGFYKLQAFSRLNEDNSKVKFGRSWKTAELRLKSNTDLAHLWYTCLRERNQLEGDVKFMESVNKGQMMSEYDRLKKVKETMRRIRAVHQERARVRAEFWTFLEDEYVEKKKEEFKKRLASEPDLPELNWKLMKAKLRDMRCGIDNVDYIERAVSKERAVEEKKKLIEARVASLPARVGFTDYLTEQLKEGEIPKMVPHKELLATHITNYKQLDSKARKLVSNMLMARRSRSAKLLVKARLLKLREEVQPKLEQLALKA